MLYIRRIAAADCDKESTLLVKRPTRSAEETELSPTLGNGSVLSILADQAAGTSAADTSISRASVSRGSVQRASVPDTLLPGTSVPGPGVPSPSVAGTCVLDGPGLSPRALALLIAVSVHREPADRNAVLFGVGSHDWAAARAPDRQGPAPPYQGPADLAELLAMCVTAGLLSVRGTGASGTDSANAWLADRWVAAELHSQLEARGRGAELSAAHGRAATYWQWRAAAWPQDRRADIHDLLEARHHLFCAGDRAQASDVTRVVCAQLHAWGDLGREAELIQSTLDMLPGVSAGRASWLAELGAIATVRRDHAAAAHWYCESATMCSALGDHQGVARAEHSLGVLAQAQGEYRKAERHYRRAAAAERRANRTAAPGGEPPDGLSASAEQAGTPAPVPAIAQVSGEARALEFSPPPAGRRSPDAVSTPGPVYKPALPPLAPVGQVPAAPQHGDRQLASPASQAAPSTQDRRTRPPRSRRARVVAVAIVAPAIAVAGLCAALLTGRQPAIRPAGQGSDQARLTRAQAASWVASQVARSSVISCDPAMCAAIQQHGVPAGDLLVLGPGGATDPLASNVVVATAPVRDEFGTRLASVYAPVVLASFGDDAARVDIRAVAPDGAAAYRSELAADLRSRARLGAELLRNPRLRIPATAARLLRSGRVDTRLLAALATLADLRPLQIVGFGDAGPGASGVVPLRSVVIESGLPNAGAGWPTPVLAFLTAQQPPYRPVRAALVRLARGQLAVRFEYPTPGPLGLLTAAANPAR